MHMLIADDNLQIRSILSEYAVKEGYTVSLAANGSEALAAFYREPPDIILLDVMMPDPDGFEVCAEIRRHSNVPIIMITARGEDFEKIMGLDLGADDYIVKPFSPSEAMARVRAIMRRLDWQPAGAEEPQLCVCDNLLIRLDTFSAAIDGKELPLTKKEMELLWTLANNRNITFSRDRLLDLVWGYEYEGESRTVDSHIKRLRAKLDRYAHPSWDIRTIWGKGYRFEVNGHA